MADDSSSWPALGPKEAQRRYRIELAERLRVARERSRVSRKDAAEAVNATTATIGNWENTTNPDLVGSLPRADEIAALCALYKVSSDWILRPYPKPLDEDGLDPNGAFLVDWKAIEDQRSAITSDDPAFQRVIWMRLDEGHSSIYDKFEIATLEEELRDHLRALERRRDIGKK